MLAELLIMSAFEKRRLFAFAYENRVPLRAGKSLFKKKKIINRNYQMKTNVHIYTHIKPVPLRRHHYALRSAFIQHHIQ
jgi:hypothetical protein